jgi:hypothetical protein
MLPNLAEYCVRLLSNSHLCHGRSGIEQCCGDPTAMRIAMACALHSLECRHPHRAEAVTELGPRTLLGMQGKSTLSSASHPVPRLARCVRWESSAVVDFSPSLGVRHHYPSMIKTGIRCRKHVVCGRGHRRSPLRYGVCGGRRWPQSTV